MAGVRRRLMSRSVGTSPGGVLAVGGVVAVWVVFSFVIGLWPGGTPAAAGTAYQYQYAGSVAGGGTILSSANKVVTFGLTAKTDSSGMTGNCAVTENATKTKISCLGVTSLTFATLSNGCSQAVLTGPAKLNKQQTTYSITATDCGLTGAGQDSFAIQAGSFARSGILTTGNIKVTIAS